METELPLCIQFHSGSPGNVCFQKHDSSLLFNFLLLDVFFCCDFSLKLRYFFLSNWGLIWILKKVNHVECVKSLKLLSISWIWFVNRYNVSTVTWIHLLIRNLLHYDRRRFLHSLLKWIRHTNRLCISTWHGSYRRSKSVILVIVSINKARNTSLHSHLAHCTCLPRERVSSLADKCWTSR